MGRKGTWWLRRHGTRIDHAAVPEAKLEWKVRLHKLKMQPQKSEYRIQKPE